MKPTKQLTVFSVVILAIAIASPAHAAPLQCADIKIGDVEACKRRVKAECTQSQYWDRRACEDAIVAKVDVCISREAEADKACLEARQIESRTCLAHLSSKLDEWVVAANRIDADEKRHAAVRKQWGACSCGLRDDVCTGTAARLKGQLTEEIDKILGRNWREEANERLASYKKGGEDMDLANAQHAAKYTKDEAQRWLDVNAKIPASLRVKEQELRAVIAAADEVLKQTAAAERADVAQRACPSGKKLDGKWAKMIKDKIGPAHTKRAKVMRQGEIYRSRNGLISTEQIPIILCEKDRVDGKDVCAVSKWGVWRERPPAGKWTSWSISVGGGYEINCAKLR